LRGGKEPAAARDIRDKLSSLEQAAIETNRGIARNI